MAIITSVIVMYNSGQAAGGATTIATGTTVTGVTGATTTVVTGTSVTGATTTVCPSGPCSCTYTQYWSGSQCLMKKSYTISCANSSECQDYNFLLCSNGICDCDYTNYWNGSQCQPKKTYLASCSNTSQCQNYDPVDLICGYNASGPPVLQCVCNGSAFWEPCIKQCTTIKKHQERCTCAINCTSYQCDPSANLQCLNDTVNNQTGGYGWCNCTSVQWWNGTYCREKGKPAWAINSSAICNSSYQCADYNLVSCPLGGNYPSMNSTCECATTKYWNGYTCLDRVTYGQSCTLWATSVLNTSTCLSAAGAGLYCTSSACSSGTCTGGTCQCPLGTTWNSTFLICAALSYG